MFPAEQAFVGRDEKRAPLKTPAWEAILEVTLDGQLLFSSHVSNVCRKALLLPILSIILVIMISSYLDFGLLLLANIA